MRASELAVKKILIIIFAVVLLSSCTNTRTLAQNEELSIKRVATIKKVYLQDYTMERPIPVDNLRVQKDSVYAKDIRYNRPLQSRRSDFSHVYVKNHIKGMVQGTLLTTSFGAVVGFLGPWTLFDRGDHALIGWSIGLVLAPLPSFILGSKDYYYLNFQPIERPDSSLQQETNKDISAILSFPSTKNSLFLGGFNNPFKDEQTYEKDWSAFISYKRYAPQIGRFRLANLNNHEIDYLNVSVSIVIDYNVNPDPDNWSYQFSLSYGLKQLKDQKTNFQPYSFMEAGFSIGERFDSNGYATRPGLVGALGWGTTIRNFSLEGQIGFMTLTMQIVPNLSVAYNF